MINVDYANIYHEDLPVDAQQVATGVDLVIAGENAGEKPGEIIDTSARYDDPYIKPYIPLPAVRRYRHALHDDYNLIKHKKLADYFDPFLPAPSSLGDGAFSIIGNYQTGDGTQIYDGDSETYIENSTAWTGSGDNLFIEYEFDYLSAHAGLVIGWRMVYSAVFADADDKFFVNKHPRYVALEHHKTAASGSGYSNIAKLARWAIPDTGGEIQDLYAVFLPSIHMDVVNVIPPHDETGWRIWNSNLFLEIIADEFPSIGAFKLFHFYPLVLDTTLLDSIAASEVVLPATRPGRLFVKGYVAPDSAVTVNGFPGGNIVAVTKGFEYTHTKEEGMITIISLEQDSIMSEADYGQRRRAIDEMVNKKIDVDAYSVMMGSRL